MKLLSGAEAWHWSVAGIGIGAVTLTLLFVANRRLGVSSGFDDVCSLVSELPYFRRDEGQRTNWRLLFLAGLLVGGALSALSTGTWSLTWEFGTENGLNDVGPVAKSAWMFVGGLAIGFGTRLAGGCTSGHGIFGVANFEWASWRTMLTFMGVGVLVTHLITYLLGAFGPMAGG